jgi:glycosyltransferase involved in cell wall biosynthesis
VVDNLSSDGSEKLLRDIAATGRIKLIERACSRGKGRQLGFEASGGNYVLGHTDCDDVFDAEGLDSLIARYHLENEGTLIMTQKRGSDEASNITMAPRTLLNQLGGWRDLNWGEDWDLWARAAGVDRYRFVPYPTEKPPHQEIKVRYGIYKSARDSFSMRRHKYADAIRTGRRMFKAGEHVSTPQRLVYYMARMGVVLSRSYLTPVPDPDFDEFAAP